MPRNKKFSSSKPAPVLSLLGFLFLTNFIATLTRTKNLPDATTRCSGNRNSCVSQDTRPSLGFQVGQMQTAPSQRGQSGVRWCEAFYRVSCVECFFFFWPVKDLRELARPITPEFAVPGDANLNANLTPTEAKKTVTKLGLEKQVS